MSKFVRIEGGIVKEIIPTCINPYTIEGIKHFYGIDFANTCVEAPDDVQQNWYYSNASFSAEKVIVITEQEKKAIRDEKVRQIMAAYYPNLTDEIGILYRGTDEEKALHEERYIAACAEANAYAAGL